VVNLFFVATSFPEELKKFEGWMRSYKLKVSDENAPKFKEDFGGIPGLLDLDANFEEAKKAAKKCEIGNHEDCGHHTNLIVNEVKLYHVRMSNTGYEQFMTAISPNISMGHFDHQGGGIVRRLMDFAAKMMHINPIASKGIKKWQLENQKLDEKMPFIDSLYIQPIGKIEDLKTKNGIDKV